MGVWSKVRTKLKIGLSTTEEKLRTFILVTGLLIVIMVAFFGGIQLTMNPGFCNLCHVMKPEYVTWEASAHSNIRCVDCHAAFEEGMLEVYKEKIMSVKHPVTMLLGKWEAPIEISSEIPAERCLQCHSNNRDYTVSGDLIVPHEKHEKAGIACVKCHSGVAHGDISERKVNGDKETLAKWTLADGEKNMIKEYEAPKMDTCIACHRSKGVTFKCEACHKSISTPEDHKNSATWIPTHGLNAEKDINACNKCHSYGVKVNSNISTGNKAVDYAWGNNFCIECHKKAPASHANREEWNPTHKDSVAKKGMKNCQACHAIKPDQAAQSPASGVFCNKCHAFK